MYIEKFVEDKTIATIENRQQEFELRAQYARQALAIANEAIELVSSDSRYSSTIQRNGVEQRGLGIATGTHPLPSDRYVRTPFVEVRAMKLAIGKHFVNYPKHQDGLYGDRFTAYHLLVKDEHTREGDRFNPNEAEASVSYMKIDTDPMVQGTLHSYDKSAAVGCVISYEGEQDTDTMSDDYRYIEARDIETVELLQEVSDAVARQFSASVA